MKIRLQARKPQYAKPVATDVEDDDSMRRATRAISPRRPSRGRPPEMMGEFDGGDEVDRPVGEGESQAHRPGRRPAPGPGPSREAVGSRSRATIRADPAGRGRRGVPAEISPEPDPTSRAVNSDRSGDIFAEESVEFGPDRPQVAELAIDAAKDPISLLDLVFTARPGASMSSGSSRRSGVQDQIIEISRSRVNGPRWPGIRGWGRLPERHAIASPGQQSQPAVQGHREEESFPSSIHRAAPFY